MSAGVSLGLSRTKNRGGKLLLSGGSASGGSGGDVQIISGSTREHKSGSMLLSSAFSGSSGVSGDIVLSTGDASLMKSGNVTLVSGKSSGGNAGRIFLGAGGSNSGSGGNVEIVAGDTKTGVKGGDIKVITGKSDEQRSGNVFIESTGNNGKIALSSANLIGKVTSMNISSTNHFDHASNAEILIESEGQITTRVSDLRDHKKMNKQSETIPGLKFEAGNGNIKMSSNKFNAEANSVNLTSINFDAEVSMNSGITIETQTINKKHAPGSITIQVGASDAAVDTREIKIKGSNSDYSKGGGVNIESGSSTKSEGGSVILSAGKHNHAGNLSLSGKSTNAKSSTIDMTAVGDSINDATITMQSMANGKTNGYVDISAGSATEDSKISIRSNSGSSGSGERSAGSSAPSAPSASGIVLDADSANIDMASAKVSAQTTSVQLTATTNEADILLNSARKLALIVDNTEFVQKSYASLNSSMSSGLLLASQSGILLHTASSADIR
jgi:hypothetical protein